MNPHFGCFKPTDAGTNKYYLLRVIDSLMLVPAPKMQICALQQQQQEQQEQQQPQQQQ